MNREFPVSFYELDQRPDPRTPFEMLPPHLRQESVERREEKCRRLALRYGMRMLSQKQREALHMRYSLGMSFRDLAAELGISRSAAARRVRRSHDELKSFIECCMLIDNELGKGS
ncbi:MAG: hypothetical protein FWE32_04660 [Oscillospiraceae bacterium]|nr:hypothetical protein [Oscillospiraceae bacterium]